MSLSLGDASFSSFFHSALAIVLDSGPSVAYGCYSSLSGGGLGPPPWHPPVEMPTGHSRAQFLPRSRYRLSLPPTPLPTYIIRGLAKFPGDSRCCSGPSALRLASTSLPVPPTSGGKAVSRPPTESYGEPVPAGQSAISAV
ncbi:hypothetical protein FRC08_015660 [Ceratobasidium sp. 394]|nr:hypothetical protein FRC08_015660 [Ceratobasidium sp. 394]